jgi:hypothetical protein
MQLERARSSEYFVFVAEVVIGDWGDATACRDSRSENPISRPGNPITFAEAVAGNVGM